MTRDGATRAWFVRIPGHGMKGSNLRATRRGILLHVEDTRNSRMAASPFHPRHKTLKPKPIQHVLSYFSSHTKQTLTSVPIHFKLRNKNRLQSMLKQIKREANTDENDDDEGREFIVYLLHGHYRGERASQGLGFWAHAKKKYLILLCMKICQGLGFRAHAK
jgi:hypothetical protein